MPRLLLVFLLLVAYSPAFAQPKTRQTRLDSLLAELPLVKPDTNRVKLLYRICFTDIQQWIEVSQRKLSSITSQTFTFTSLGE